MALNPLLYVAGNRIQTAHQSVRRSRSRAPLLTSVSRYDRLRKVAPVVNAKRERGCKLVCRIQRRVAFGLAATVVVQGKLREHVSSGFRVDWSMIQRVFETWAAALARPTRQDHWQFK